jgi:GTP:adenosylcobinamide-phosphate guanylyltransferase
VRAVVLAGGKNRGALRAVSPVTWEALIPIHGRPMVDYVVTALIGHPRIRHVRVMGPEAVPRSGVEYIAPEDALWDNLAQGLADLPDDDPVLVATADIPLVTTPIVDRFLTAAPDREVVYPVVARTVTERRFPGVRRTYFRLREGAFTGGNVFLVRPGAVRRAQNYARQLLAHRKQPWRLAGDIGLGVLIRFLLQRLSLKDAERTAGRLLKIDGSALVFGDPEVGVDVDKPSDLALVTRILEPPREGSRHA